MEKHLRQTMLVICLLLILPRIANPTPPPSKDAYTLKTILNYFERSNIMLDGTLLDYTMMETSDFNNTHFLPFKINEIQRWAFYAPCINGTKFNVGDRIELKTNDASWRYGKYQKKTGEKLPLKKGQRYLLVMSTSFGPEPFDCSGQEYRLNGFYPIVEDSVQIEHFEEVQELRPLKHRRKFVEKLSIDEIRTRYGKTHEEYIDEIKELSRGKS